MIATPSSLLSSSTITASSTSVRHYYALNDYYHHRQLLPNEDYCPNDECWRPQRLLPPSTISSTIVDYCHRRLLPHRRVLAPSTITTPIHDFSHHRRLLPSTIIAPSASVGHYSALNNYSPIDECWPLLRHRLLLAPSMIVDHCCALHDYGPIDHYSHHPSTITTPIGDYCHRRLLPPSMISPTIDDYCLIDDCSHHR